MSKSICRPRGSERPSRRGVAIILVMAMISVAMAVSYAMLRSQTVSVLSQKNGDRRMLARNAAMVGLAAGLRAMHLNSWTGCGTTVNGSLNAYDSYSVTFTAGDESLSASSPNYSDTHFRVTVTATGKSISPTNSQVLSTFTSTAVAQLVPRQLATEPTNWSNVRSNTIYQTNTGQFSIDIPGRVEGPVRLQGALRLGSGYGWSNSTRNRYLSDLNSMRSARSEVQTVSLNNETGGTYRLVFNGATTSTIAYNASSSTVRTALRNLSTIGSTGVNVSGSNGGPYTVSFTGALANQDVAQLSTTSVALSGSGASVSTATSSHGWPGYADDRPLTGPVNLPTGSTEAQYLGLLTSELGLTVNNISVSSPMSVPLPTTLTTYRLFPGGRTYNVTQIGSSLANTTLAPDPANNPLGIFFCSGSTTLGNNVRVNGTLITGSGLTISGTNVAFTPVDLRPPSGSSTTVRLPAAVVRQTLAVGTSVSAAVEGFLVVGQQFVVQSGDAGARFALTGRLVTNEFILNRRDAWNLSSTIWNLLLTLFGNQILDVSGISYFPIYMGSLGADPDPLLTLKPDTTPLFEHWQDLANPIYVAHPSDPGLRWDIVRME